eukprot:636568-Pleurochrysis_carterae.AAC.1
MHGCERRLAEWRRSRRRVKDDSMSCRRCGRTMERKREGTFFGEFRWCPRGCGVPRSRIETGG